MAEDLTTPVRILHVEDAQADIELLADTLRAQGMSCDVVRVGGDAALRSALATQRFDIVISDFTLAGWSGLDALRVVNEFRPELPFVFVAGSIGEDVTIEMLRCGATDYVLKDRLFRLAPAIRRALAEAEERKRRREAEEALRDSHRFVKRVLDSSPNLIYVYDLTSRRFVYVGGRLSLMGYTREGLLAMDGASLTEIVHPEDQPRLEAHRKRIAETDDEQVVEIELRVRHSDGNWRWLHCGEVVFGRGRGGAAREVLGVAQDVTEKKAAEAQFLRTQRLESLGAMAGGIAHDLNNVLSPILMSVEILRRRLPAEDARISPLLNRIEGSARRGADMVKQILLFARGSEGEHQTLDLSGLLGDVVKLAQQTFPKGISVRAERPEVIDTVRGDQTQIHQVLVNLCVNARDAMPYGGTLTLSAAAAELGAEAALRPDARSGRYVRISVADTGTGIPKEIRERIFEPFFTTKPLGQGTGLGLSTSLAIVTNHRGFVDLESVPGRGTTFHVHLPAAENAAAEAAPLGLSDAAEGRGETVLLVDDEEMILDLARETLEAAGYRVLCARNGQDAIGVLQGSGAEVDAIVTDLAMPVMDGLGLISALPDIAPRARVILATGQEQALEGFQGPLLRKPFTLVELLSVIRRSLDA